MSCKTYKPGDLEPIRMPLQFCFSFFEKTCRHIGKKCISKWCRLMFFIAFITMRPVHAQQYSFTHVSSGQGLSQKYIYDVIQDRLGFMWIATGEGLCRFDGHEVITYAVKKHLVENFCTKLFLSSAGEMWIGHNQGGITCMNKNVFTPVFASNAANGPLIDFAEPQTGCIVGAFQRGSIMVNCEGKTKTFKLGGPDCFIYSMTVHEQTLVCFTSQGQYRVRLNRHGHPFIMQMSTNKHEEEKLQTVMRDVADHEVYWAITSGGTLLRGHFKDLGRLDLQPVNIAEPLENAQRMIQAADGSFWVATYKGVYHLSYNSMSGRMRLLNQYTTQNGLRSDFVKTVFIDNESNVWIGLYGEGLAALNDECFTYYRYPQYLRSNDIKSLLVLPGETWLGTDYGIMYLNHDNEKENKFFNSQNGFRTETVVAICNRGDNIIAGTASGGLFIYSRQKRQWRQQLIDRDNLRNQVTDVKKSVNGLWVGTRGGLFLFNDDFKLVRSWTTGNGIIHNYINSIYVDDDQSIWVTMPGNKIAHINHNKVENIEVTGPSQFVDISCVVRDREGKLWIGTYGNGIIVKKGNTLKQIRTRNGLPSDYVYSIIAGDNNGIWAGHRGSLSRIDLRNYKVSVFDEKNGISVDFNTLASTKDLLGNIWFGTSNGVLRFDASRMRANHNPPRVALKNVWCGDKKLDPSQTTDLSYGHYKFKFNFIGISLTKPQEVRYRYMLKGFDTEWSELTTVASVTYPRLQEGEYTFMVKAYNADGYASKPVALYHINISLPVWKRWWFFLLAALALVIIIVLIIRIREDNQQKMVNYLEKNLAIRTSELMEQKQLVEEQNKDIVDSINYALRIQTALLPEIRLLKSWLPESFVMYKPRDIVSGDFYWFSRVGNRLLLACADCTGHGVPGAFMSMISNTLFNEILPVSDERDPAQMLYKIDEKMRQLLQHDVNESLNDGMDLVLLSLDLETGVLDFSGAVRPVLHFSGHRVEEYKTSRSSIGGPETDKNFINQRVQLKQGDAIYIFSDGMVDQFGGPEKRKLRLRGLVGLLRDIQHRSMEEQRFMAEKFFDEWTGNESQIDDVLLIGFRYTGPVPEKQTREKNQVRATESQKLPVEG